MSDRIHRNLDTYKTRAVLSLFDIDLESDSDSEDDSLSKLEFERKVFVDGIVKELRKVAPSVASDIEKMYNPPPSNPEALLIQRVAKGHLGREEAREMKINKLLKDQQDILDRMEVWHLKEKEEVLLDKETEDFFTSRVYDEAQRVKRNAASQLIGRWLKWCLTRRK